MKFFTFLLLCFFVLLFDVNTLSILCWIRKVVHIRSNIFVSFTDSMKCWDRMRKKNQILFFASMHFNQMYIFASTILQNSQHFSFFAFASMEKSDGNGIGVIIILLLLLLFWKSCLCISLFSFDFYIVHMSIEINS